MLYHLLDFIIKPRVKPNATCRMNVITGTSGAIFSPAIPAPNAGNMPNQTVTINSTIIKITA